MFLIQIKYKKAKLEILKVTVQDRPYLMKNPNHSIYIQHFPQWDNDLLDSIWVLHRTKIYQLFLHSNKKLHCEEYPNSWDGDHHKY